MLTLGQGVTRDDSVALTLFHQAADKGSANAQDSLGWMYERGRGVQMDREMAREWYRKAAAQGFAKAIDNEKRLMADDAN